MASDDEDITVFGQKRPLDVIAARASTSPLPRSAPGSLDELTIFGEKLPTQVLSQGQVGYPAQPGKNRRAWGRDDTWLGGRVMAPVRRTKIPEAPRPRRIVQQPPRLLQRIAFTDALRSVGLETGASSNPLLAAASDLLTLFGRLRTGMVEMPALPLHDHIVGEISAFEQKCRDQDVASDDIAVARYALAAMADDVIETIPGNDPAFWSEHSIAAKLLDDHMAGTGFFTKLEQVIAEPRQHSQLLELMLTCLSLGFQGQYRGAPNGQADLSQLRSEIYQHFRTAAVRPPKALSHNWKPVVLPDRLAGDAPLWVIGGVAAAVVVAQFATLSWILSADAQAAQNQIIALHTGAPPVEIQRTEEVVVYEAPQTGQLERLKERFTEDIAQGTLEVEEQGDFIVIRERDALQFGSGAAGPATELDELAKRVATALDAEPGLIVIEGHSDNIPVRGTGRYKTNEELSAARAAAVRDLLAPYLSDPTRVSIVGVGPAKPLDQADTEAARAKKPSRGNFAQEGATVVRRLFGSVAFLGVLSIVAAMWFGLPMTGIPEFASPWVRFGCIVICLGSIAIGASQRARRRRRAAEALEASLIGDGAVLAERMQAALSKLKESGGATSLYDLPWYVMIGPPGAGKTTALVHSGLDFPGTDASAVADLRYAQL